MYYMAARQHFNYAPRAGKPRAALNYNKATRVIT